MPITALPALDRTSANFKANVDTFFGSQLPTFSTEAEAARVEINNNTTSASTSASTATTKASEALTSANNAATSKTGADTARDAAVVARTAAESALDSFDDRYLGPKATAPTLDNDGAALLTGALYWDTALPGMRSWNGTAWVTLPAATAAAISNTPAGSIAATTVQAAINELDSEKAALAGANFTGALTEGGKQTYNRGNILGAVSQSAGVPTGALMEYGSNANGEYWRYAGGQQICRALLPDFSVSANSNTNQTWTFPAAFATTPSCPPWLGAPSINFDIGGFICHQGLTATNNTQVFKNGATAQVVLTPFAIAVGRWF